MIRYSRTVLLKQPAFKIEDVAIPVALVNNYETGAILRLKEERENLMT